MDFNNDNINKNQENQGQPVNNSYDDKTAEYPQNLGGYNFNSNPQEDEQKNSYISVKSLPRKRHWFRRALSYIACIVISALVGGVAGGAYVNYYNGGSINKSYTFPSTSDQNSKTNSISYTQPSSIIAKIAAETGPSIVGVDTEIVKEGFFGQNQVAEGSGSGIIFDKSGYIVTNQHVIDGGRKITVTLPGGKKQFVAKVVGQDTTSDIAVLKINATNLPVAKFGDSSKVRVGDLAIAIGNPLGEEYAGSVTSGVISGLNRSENIRTDDNSGNVRSYKLIQTDAAINPGNSGGALINENGEVIGINSIKFVDSNVEGMGFAIPINDAKTIIEQLMKNGYVSRPYLGVYVVTITDELAKQYSCPAGVGVDSVQAGGAAEAAGIKAGDVILEINGVKLPTSDDLINELQKHKAGESVKLKVWQKSSNSTATVNVKLAEKSQQTN
ncbi:MAG: trypsin-like peptidase domain-containing protein [Clostridiales bacterium]|nr:trypsin-like peptidase domain-containing protein [Clostridiales bacterium]HBM80766.1 hypothetical protein [Clostridiaceae bacterium]